MNLVNLNVHSKASMLYASSDIKELVKKAKALGQPAIALTDYANLFNAVTFYSECERQGVKPLLGATINFCEDAAEMREQKIRQE